MFEPEEYTNFDDLTEVYLKEKDLSPLVAMVDSLSRMTAEQRVKIYRVPDTYYGRLIDWPQFETLDWPNSSGWTLRVPKIKKQVNSINSTSIYYVSKKLDAELKGGLFLDVPTPITTYPVHAIAAANAQVASSSFRFFKGGVMENDVMTYKSTFVMTKFDSPVKEASLVSGVGVLPILPWATKVFSTLSISKHSVSLLSALYLTDLRKIWINPKPNVIMDVSKFPSCPADKRHDKHYQPFSATGKSSCWQDGVPVSSGQSLASYINRNLVTSFSGKFPKKTVSFLPKDYKITVASGQIPFTRAALSWDHEYNSKQMIIFSDFSTLTRYPQAQIIVCPMAEYHTLYTLMADFAGQSMVQFSIGLCSTPYFAIRKLPVPDVKDVKVNGGAPIGTTVKTAGNWLFWCLYNYGNFVYNNWRCAMQQAHQISNIEMLSDQISFIYTDKLLVACAKDVVASSTYTAINDALEKIDPDFKIDFTYDANKVPRYETSSNPNDPPPSPSYTPSSGYQEDTDVPDYVGKRLNTRRLFWNAMSHFTAKACLVPCSDLKVGTTCKHFCVSVRDTFINSQDFTNANGISFLAFLNYKEIYYSDELPKEWETFAYLVPSQQ
jgi:hypothetical protein